MPTRITPKRRTKVYFDKKDHREAVLRHCEKEYEKTFGHAWENNPLRGIEEVLERGRIEVEAWSVMNELAKAASMALKFFESRGLDPNMRDHGIYYAHELHALLKKRRRLLESLCHKVGKRRAPVDRRQLLVRRVNVGGPNPFVGPPYKREVGNRELAIINILSMGGEDITFDVKGMTVSDAIEQERRRMALAARRAMRSRIKWPPPEPEEFEPEIEPPTSPEGRSGSKTEANGDVPPSNGGDPPVRVQVVAAPAAVLRAARTPRSS